MKLTVRGKVVFGILIALALWGLWEVVANLWWTGKDFCWGSLTECLKRF
jgi:hypothetical protein